MKAKVEAVAAYGINCFTHIQLPRTPTRRERHHGHRACCFRRWKTTVARHEIASTFDRSDLVKLGRRGLIEEIIIGEDEVCTFLWAP